jgi:hypothetical protein
VNIALATEYVGLYEHFTADGAGNAPAGQCFGEFDVFRYAAIFLTCFLELLGKEFGLWDPSKVQACWDADGGERRCPEGPGSVSLRPCDGGLSSSLLQGLVKKRRRGGEEQHHPSA